MLFTIILFIIILGLLVFVHELGHFFMARRFGVKAEEFGFGYPPRIAGVYKDKNGVWKFVRGRKKIKDAPGTVYSLNWIPVGGFVKIKGESGDNDDADSFISKKIWQRAMMLLAGVSMNIILAMVLISFGFIVGLPQVVDSLGAKAKVKDEQIQIVQVLPGSPAKEAGVTMGDIIISINGREFIDDLALQNYTDEHTGQKLTYVFKRGDEIITKEITPKIIESTGRGGIGIAVAETGIVSYPWYIALWEGIKTTIFLTWAIIVAFYQLLKGIIMGQGVSADIAGPVGIAAITGQVARLGFVYIVQFAAILSINLAIINAFPFPALDGGRTLFLVIEKIKGKPIKREVEAIIHNIGFALLMLLVLVVTFRDISRFGDSFKSLWERIAG